MTIILIILSLTLYTNIVAIVSANTVLSFVVVVEDSLLVVLLISIAWRYFLLSIIVQSDYNVVGAISINSLLIITIYINKK